MGDNYGINVSGGSSSFSGPMAFGPNAVASSGQLTITRQELTAKLDDLGRMVRSDFEVNDPPTAQQAVRDVRAELESAEPNRKTIRDRLAALASASQ